MEIHNLEKTITYIDGECSMGPKNSRKTALGDIRVLDLAGPLATYCTKLLADLGADVIKIERPGGCSTRNIGPFFHDEPHPEKSLYFHHFNTNKRSVTLDIATADGRDILKRLVETTDILIETFPPGYLENLGLDYPALQKLNSGLILTSVTPFGQTGPYRDYKGSDIIGLALGGLLYIGGFPEDPPHQAGASQAFHQTSVNACVAALAALHNRDITGEGQWIDVSMQECVAVALQYVMQFYDLRKEIVVRNGTPLATTTTLPVRRLPAMGLFPCQNGYVNLFPRGRFHELIEWMDSRQQAGDLKEERWQYVMELISTAEGLLKLFSDTEATEKYMMQECPHIDAVVAEFVSKHTKIELCEEGQKWRIPVVPVNDVRDLVENPQLLYRQFFAEIPGPEPGLNMRDLGAPYRFSETPWRITQRAPLIGEHNLEIYHGEFGLTVETVRLFKEGGII